MKATQIRGTCQCCGRQQAVVNGKMSKHGYTVKMGWFSGVCTGQHYVPMQVSREVADKIVAEIRAEIPQLLAKADQVKAGEIKPVSIMRSVSFKEKVEVAFADATSMEQRHALHAMEWNLRLRAKAGEDFSKMLEETANKVHGTALTEVSKKEPAMFIMPRDQKTGHGMTYTCTSVEGARVYYKVQKGETFFKGWMGSQAWRKMASV